MQWKGDVVASPRRGGRLAPREQRCPLPPSTPQALGVPVKGTEKKKGNKTTQKAQGVGGEGKRQLRVGLGTPPSCQEALQKRAAALRRGKGGGQAGRGRWHPPGRWPHGAAVGAGAAWRGAAGGRAPPHEASWGWRRWWW